MKILCFEYKVVSVQYFMDDMRVTELDTIIDNVKFCDRSAWDTARIICLISAQKASKKKLRLRDLFELPWDKLDQSDEEMKHILEQQKSLENYLNNI